MAAREHVHGAWDRELGHLAVRVLPGEYRVGGEGLALTTLLGSCVSACITDPLCKVGGMNHFMLPHGGEGPDGDSARYGLFAMEVLLNELYHAGAKRERLRAKIFGGGNVMRDLVSDPVGQRNVDFVRGFLALERIAIVGEDLLGEHGRKVAYYPDTGRAAVRRVGIDLDRRVAAEDAKYLARLDHVPLGEPELF